MLRSSGVPNSAPGWRSSARDGSSDPRWIETDAFWVWHFANAYETDETPEDRRVLIDFPWWSSLGFTVDEC